MSNMLCFGNGRTLPRLTLLILLAFANKDLNAGWRWSNPLPHGNNISEMAYSADLGLVVQVTDKGRIYISSDLYSWMPVESGVTNALRAVTFFGSRIIITGENGLILFSDDGYKYQKANVNPPTTDWFEGVASGRLNINSTLTPVVIAVGDNGSIYSSFDGSNWVKRANSYTNWLRGICIGNRFGNPLAVAVGEAGIILTSPNLTTWNKVTSITSQHLNRITFTNGNFYVVGENGTALIGMSGGSTWIPETTGATNSLNTMAFGQIGTRLYAGNNEVRYYNGTTWVNFLAGSLPLYPPAWNYTASLAVNAVNVVNDVFLLGGSSGFMCLGSRANNAFSWSIPYDSIRQWIWDVSTDAGFYIAVGNNGLILSSQNGVSWDVELTPLAATNSVLLGVGGDTNMLVAVGSQGTVLYTTNEMLPEISTNYVGTNMVITTNYISALGVIWYSAPKFNTNAFQGVCKWNGLYYIAGDNGLIYRSSNGTNWTRIITPTTNTLSGLASFVGGIVAVGSKGTILFTQDGSNWSSIPSGTTNWLYKVRYLNTNFVIVGNNGTLLTSVDGVNWTRQTTGVSKWLTDVVYLKGTYYAVGTQGAFLFSTNLVNWTVGEIITGKSLYAAGVSDGQLIAAGVEGVILRNQLYPFSTPVEIVKYGQTKNYTDGTIQHLFLFYGKPDQRFSLDATQKLGINSSWTASEPLEITDPSGFLYYIESDYLTNQPNSEFFRTRTVW